MMRLEPELPRWMHAGIGAPVAIFGRASSGRAASALLEGLGATCHVFDQQHEEDSLRDFGRSDLARYRLAVASPGFAADHEWIGLARERGCEVVPEIDLGASLWEGPIIAITGTNGKTTLTEFLVAALNSSGIEAFACGNIGRPFSSLVSEEMNREAIAVCEVSSFQAELSKHLRPDTVVWTNFDEDHLDRHGSMESYFASKYRLIELMRGECVFHDESVASFARVFGRETREHWRVDAGQEARSLGVNGTLFEALPERNTFVMARAVWDSMGLDRADLIEAAKVFQKSPHRMELVARRGGVSYWDDSKSTNFHAVFGALERFEDPVHWIGGGRFKGGDRRRFAAGIAPSLASAHLIGECALDLKAMLEKNGVLATVYDSMEEAVAGASSSAACGANILLSPGFASLDMYDGY